MNASWWCLFGSLLVLGGCAEGTASVPLMPPDGGLPIVLPEIDGGLVSPPTQIPVALGCPAGALDLAAQSTPNATTLIELSAMPTFDPGDGDFPRTAPQKVCIPADTESLLFTVPPEAYFHSVLSPFDGELIVEGDYWASPARPGNGTVLLPPLPGQQFAGGVFEFSVHSDAASVEGSIAIRRGPSAGRTLHINLIYVNSSLTQRDFDQFNVGFRGFAAFLGTMGVSIGEVAVAAIQDPTLEIADAEDPRQDELRAAAPVVTYGSTPLWGDGLAIYAIREITSGSARGVLAFSPLVGPTPRGRQGIVFGLEDARDTAGDIIPLTVSTTLLHELGHYVGLPHSSEAEGTTHDPFTDTLECGSENDRNGDGIVSSDECVGRGADNALFWMGDVSGISPQQAHYFSTSPLLR